MTRSEFLNIIKTNIHDNEYHLTLVNGGQHPEFSYTIGLTEKLGFELIIAGGFISVKDNEAIFRYIYNQLKSGHKIESEFKLSENNVYYLSKVDSSWSKKLMIGVYDYYNLDEITAYQIISVNRTMDIPLMSEFKITDDPIWKWLDLDWNFNVPKNSYIITNIDSLQGKTITELTRWEEHVWEMFSKPGPDVKEEDIRIVSLGTILGIDNTLQPILNLAVGEGLWRDNKDSEWQNW
ncbi:DUF4262 domain-containing protein [Flavobacterium sp. ANB]|uniref:DUF4262 domain-containing protein n=1 Tax=unclassified Flavobacterium TaxID=196869 RepID=UPI0012B791C1|nr:MULTISPECIES: DUF4262 domain-containing protein [unclassified Flavobacterium]MBF4519515.1 DUF4262 domain-containing protein [Flavobacterium sp. ANB]MTD72385.1 DUF4262 domain-containing protein [Flavobacterium sp. LC2016-13]